MALDKVAIAVSLEYSPPARRRRAPRMGMTSLRSVILDARDAQVLDGVVTWVLDGRVPLASEENLVGGALRDNPYGARLAVGEQDEAASLVLPFEKAPVEGLGLVELMVPGQLSDVRVWLVFASGWSGGPRMTLDIDGCGRERTVGPFVSGLPEDVASDLLLCAKDALRGTVELRMPSRPDKEVLDGCRVRFSSDHRALRFPDAARQSWGSVCEVTYEELTSVSYLLDPSLLKPGWNNVQITASVNEPDVPGPPVTGLLNALRLPLPFGTVGSSLERINLTRAVRTRGRAMRSPWVWNASSADADIICSGAEVRVLSLTDVGLESHRATAEEPNQLSANSIGIANLLFEESPRRPKAERPRGKTRPSRKSGFQPPEIRLERETSSERGIVPSLSEAVEIQELGALEAGHGAREQDVPVLMAEKESSSG